MSMIFLDYKIGQIEIDRNLVNHFENCKKLLIDLILIYFNMFLNAV